MTKLRGLSLSAAPATDRSAYTHRIKKLAECLESYGVTTDFFFIPEYALMGKETLTPVFMPLHARKLRNYDFIYCGGEESAQALFFCRMFLDCPVIVDIHGNLLAQSALMNEINSNGKCRKPSLRVMAQQKMGFSAADHVLTVCKPQLDAFVSEGVPRDNISLIRNGVDLQSFQPLEQPSDDVYTFGYVGAFQFWQGIDNLIEAFELFDDPGARLLLVGFSPKDRALKNDLKAKFGERVELIDRVDRSEMIDLIQRIRILIIPRIDHLALKYAFPTKFAEYAALGRPVMVNDVDETAEFVRKYDCGFVSAPEPEAMAEIMRKAACSTVQELEQMGINARKMAQENFSWERIGGEYFEAIQTAVKRYRKK
jgi:glycosyltransferase involved in cell wall biosynthesis